MKLRVIIRLFAGVLISAGFVYADEPASSAAPEDLLADHPVNAIYRQLLRPGNNPGPEYYLDPSRADKLLKLSPPHQIQEDAEHFLKLVALPYFQHNLTGLGEIEDFVAGWDEDYRRDFFQSFNWQNINPGQPDWFRLFDELDLKLQTDRPLSHLENILVFTTMAHLGVARLAQSDRPADRQFFIDLEEYFFERPDRVIAWLQTGIAYPFLIDQARDFRDAALDEMALPLLSEILKASETTQRQLIKNLRTESRFQNFEPEATWLIENVLKPREIPSQSTFSSSQVRRLALVLSLQGLSKIDTQSKVSFDWSKKDLESFRDLFIHRYRGRIQAKPLGEFSEGQISAIIRESNEFQRDEFIEAQNEQYWSNGVSELSSWSHWSKWLLAGMLLYRGKTAAKAIRVNFLRQERLLQRHLRANLPASLKKVSPARLEKVIGEFIRGDKKLPAKANPAFREGIRTLQQYRQTTEKFEKRLSRRFSSTAWERASHHFKKFERLGSVHQNYLSTQLHASLQSIASGDRRLKEAERMMAFEAGQGKSACQLSVANLGTRKRLKAYENIEKKHLAKIVRTAKKTYREELRSEWRQLQQNPRVLSMAMNRIKYGFSYITPRLKGKLRGDLRNQSRRWPWTGWRPTGGNYQNVLPGASLEAASLSRIARAGGGLLPYALVGYALSDVWRAFRPRDYAQVWYEQQEEKWQFVENELQGNIDGLFQQRQRRLERLQVQPLQDDLDSAFEDLNQKRREAGEDTFDYKIFVPSMAPADFGDGFMNHLYILILPSSRRGGLLENNQRLENSLLVRMELELSEERNFELSERLGIGAESTWIPESAAWRLESATLLSGATERDRRRLAKAFFFDVNGDLDWNESFIQDFFDRPYDQERFWAGETLPPRFTR